MGVRGRLDVAVSAPLHVHFGKVKVQQMVPLRAELRVEHLEGDHGLPVLRLRRVV